MLYLVLGLHLFIHSAVAQSCHGSMYGPILLSLVYYIRLDAVKMENSKVDGIHIDIQ